MRRPWREAPAPLGFVDFVGSPDAARRGARGVSTAARLDLLRTRCPTGARRSPHGGRD